MWADLLGLDRRVRAERRRPTRSQRLDPRLVARAPLLGPVLGLALPDSDLTASFDGELRKTSLEDLLGRLLGALASGAGGVVVVVEDAHWLDPLSRDLLEALARAIVRVGRCCWWSPPAPTARRWPGCPSAAATTSPTWSWSRSGAEASAVLVARAAPGPRPAASRDPELVATVVGRAEGNAFYLEQLVDYVARARRPRRTATIDPDALELPPSLHSLVLSRIDAQPEGPRRAVKVASVIGRAFRSPLVAAAYPDLGSEDGRRTATWSRWPAPG